MFINPIIGMIHNTGSSTFHPVLFIESPLPGNPEGIIRHKSKGHHTAGFSSRDDAVASAHKLAADMKAAGDGEARMSLSDDIPWDGQGVPAMVAYFADRNGECVRVM